MARIYSQTIKNNFIDFPHHFKTVKTYFCDDILNFCDKHCKDDYVLIQKPLSSHPDEESCSNFYFKNKNDAILIRLYFS